MTLSSFHFHLLRVTMAQMLKAHGFSKSDNRSLDVMSDICIKFLRLLTLTVNKYMELRNDTEPTLEDVVRALNELNLISPHNELGSESTDLTAKGIDNFEAWFMGDMNKRLRETARPNEEFVKAVVSKQKMKDVGSKMSSLTAAFDQQSKEAMEQNPTLPYQQSSPMAMALRGVKRPKEDDLTVDDDWVKFMIRRQLNENPDLKINGTVLIDYVPEDKRPAKKIKPNKDYVIIGPTPPELEPALPYSSRPEDDDASQDVSD